MPRLSASTLAVIYRNLAMMLSAGVDTVRSFRTAAEHLDRRARRVFDQLADATARGDSLAVGFRDQRTYLGHVDVEMITAAEQAGSVAEVLDQLAAFHQFRAETIRTMTHAFALPALLLHAGAVLAPLPLLILGRVDMPGYLLQAAAFLAPFYTLALLVVLVRTLSGTRGLARRTLDAVTLHIPLLGKAVRDLAYWRFFRAVNALYSAGVQIDRALEIAADAGGNQAAIARLRGGAQAARQGRPASEGFSPHLPREIRAAWEVGEQSGKLDEVTRRLAATAGESALLRFSTLATWLPRIVYFLVALRLAVAVLQGYGALYSQLGNTMGR